MKKWLLERFLPMWAKETVLRENRCLAAENAALSQRIREKDAYIKGIHKGLRQSRNGQLTVKGHSEDTQCPWESPS